MKYISTQNGIAAIEFALVLPCIMVILIGIATFSHAFMLNNTLERATRNGARYIAENATNGAGIIDISNETRTIARNLIINGTEVNNIPLMEGLSPTDININELTGDPKHFLVSVTYHFIPLFSHIPMFGFREDINLDFPLTATIIGRAL